MRHDDPCAFCGTRHGLTTATPEDALMECRGMLAMDVVVLRGKVAEQQAEIVRLDDEVGRLKGLLHSEQLCAMARCDVHERSYQGPEHGPRGCPWCADDEARAEVERLRAERDEARTERNEAIAALARHRGNDADAYAAGHNRERAAIVAWLRRVRPHLDRTADDIERGEHER